MNERRLVRLRDRILIDMDFQRHTVPHHEDIYCSFDIHKYKEAVRSRFDPYKDEPMKQAADLCLVLRHIVNEDESRQVRVLELFEMHPRMIIFYTFDYERDILMNLAYGDDVEIAEYSGHAHESIPDAEKWVYLVQYTAGAEGFNCVLNTPYRDLYYYHLKSRSGIDLAISKALSQKKKFNERKFAGWDK